MFKPLSTRNKPVSHQKGQSSARFFKKFSTDENERNYLNQIDKLHFQKGTLVSKNLISLTLQQRNDDSKGKSGKHMKSQINMINLTKPIKSHTSFNISDNKENREPGKMIRKQSSVKNLKLATLSSIQFPPLMVKSASQTTVNKKLDENRLKLFDKMGIKKKADKCQKIQKPKIKKSAIKINQFKLGKKLGSGRFGNVYIAEEKQTKAIFAIKVMSKSKIKEADMEDQVFWEIKLQTYMDHPNILKLYHFFDDAKYIYLILEYCSQCLFKQFRSKVKFSEEDTSYFTKQVVSSLKYLHNQNIIHRDIKPENIMIQYGVIKLSDFGWSTYSPLYKRQTFCGTVDYVPPEIVQGNKYDERVDIWALGILLYELSSGFAPFETKDQNVTYEKIVKSECKYPQHFSKQLKDTISKILDKNPSNRPNLEQIQSEPWFQKFKGVGRYISKQIWNAWNTL